MFAGAAAWYTDGQKKEVAAVRSAAPMKAAKIGYLVISALLCMMGVLVIVHPEASMHTVGMLCGLMLIAFGAIKLVGYFSKDLFRLAFENDLSSGVLMLVLGSSLLLHTEGSLAFFCTVLGILILTDGLIKVQISVEAGPFGIRQWPLLLVAAIVTACFGCALIFRPSARISMMGRLLGVSLIVDGVLNVITMLMTVKIIERQYADEMHDPCAPTKGIG